MPTITVAVKCSNDQKYSVTIDTSKTVLEFKNAIAEQSNTAADRQRLIYSGRVLKDNDTLETYKITEGHTVHMVRSQASGDTSQTSSRTAPPANANTPENPPSTTQPGVSPSTLPATNPFAQFGQFGYGGYNQNPNPYVLPEQILQNPAMMQYFQQMIQDPTFIESMIAMNPNLSQFAPQLRQMLQDPEVLALISNPETLRNMHSMMAPLVFGGGGGGGGAVPGIPGATTNNNNNTSTNTTSTSPSSGTTNTDNTTPATPANNPLFFNLFNPAATTTTGTGTNPAQTPVMPLFDPAMWGAFAMPPVGGSASPAAPQIPPEERFQVQLRQLNEMGFFDAQKNIRALQVCQGNVNLAIERLLDPSFN